MASTGDDASETDSVPDDVFQTSSSPVTGAEQEDQYAENTHEGGEQNQLKQGRDYNEEGRDAQTDDEDASAADDSDEERENRFDGPASTWRFYTESERNLAASLDQQRANDLSLHLYNAYALKAKARDAETAAQAKHYHGKKKWMKADEDGTLPWHPDAHWTAWPLNPGDVPRPAEVFGVPMPSRDEERASLQGPVSWKPSLDLEDEVQAIMLRQAKNQFQTRADPTPTQEPSLSRMAAQESSPRKRKRSPSRSSSTSPSSHAANGRPGPASDGHGQAASDVESKFDVLIDDEKAARILQPSVRYVISQLDELLLGLHRSRRGHVREPPSPRSRSRYERRKSRSRARPQADGEDEDGLSAGTSGATKQNNGTMSKYQSKSWRTTGAISPAVGPDGTEENAHAAKEGKKSKRKPPLNPRDWSEVLGIASLVGWDTQVVQRASERCASLFQETMTFRQLGKKSETGITSMEEVGATDIVEDEEVKEGYVCPIASCSRHSEPWPLNKTWRWREHLKRSHKYSKADVEKLEEQLKTGRNHEAAVREDAGGGGDTRADDAHGSEQGTGNGSEVID